MLKLLKSDFYKLSKTKSFFICLCILLCLAVGYVFLSHYSYQFVSSEPHPGASELVAETFSANSLIFSSIVVSLFVACEFGFGTMKNIASKGFGRTEIYLSKLIVSCVVSTVFLLAYSLASVATGSILWGFGSVGAGYWQEICQIIGLEALLNLAFTSVFVFFAALVRQSGGAIAINICLLSFASTMVQMGQMLLHYLFKVEWDISQYLISSNIVVISQGNLNQETILRGLLVGVAYFVVTTLAGVWLFHKRDIK